jgi:hypothetical protein
MAVPLRVVAVVDAPVDRVRAAAADLPEDVRSSAVATPAGVVLTLERRAPAWRRARVVRRLQRLLDGVLGQLG